MSKVNSELDPQYNDPIEKLRLLPDQLKLGQTSKVRHAIQEVLDYVEKKNDSVLLKNIKPEDVLLIEIATPLSSDRKNQKGKELSEMIGCKVVIIDAGMKAVRSISHDLVDIIQSKINVDKLVEKINKKLAESM